MKYVLLFILLGSYHYSSGLFRCFSKANAHVKLKENENAQANFLAAGINSPKTITLRLTHPETHQERFLTRSIREVDLKKTAQWTLAILNDRDQCLEITDAKIIPATNNVPLTYKWLLHPKKPGIVLLEAVYKDNDKKEPYRQTIWVTIE